MSVKSTKKPQSLRDPLHPEVRLRLAREKPFFGRGPADLLHFIEENQSVRRACEKMGMSYSKGWKIIRDAESALTRPLVHRQPGGRDGGSSSLTLEGKALLEAYDRFESAVKAQTAQIFALCFASILEEATPAEGDGDHASFS